MALELEDFQAYLAERNRVFRELDVVGARRLLGEPAAPEASLLIGLHKARVMWRDASDAEVAQSREWLEKNGYRVPARGDFAHQT